MRTHLKSLPGQRKRIIPKNINDQSGSQPTKINFPYKVKVIITVTWIITFLAIGFSIGFRMGYNSAITDIFEQLNEEQAAYSKTFLP